MNYYKIWLQQLRIFLRCLHIDAIGIKFDLTVK